MTWLDNDCNTRTTTHRRPYRQRISKLSRYRAELAQLRREGKSIRQIQAWLCDRPCPARSASARVASLSTIWTFLQSLPELQNA